MDLLTFPLRLTRMLDGFKEGRLRSLSVRPRFPPVAWWLLQIDDAAQAFEGRAVLLRFHHILRGDGNVIEVGGQAAFLVAPKGLFELKPV